MENKASSEIRHSILQKVYLGFKRCVVFILSLIGLAVLLPVFLIVAIAIKLDDGGPVFFCQERLCRGGKVMKMYKFRSMRADAEEKGKLEGKLEAAREMILSLLEEKGSIPENIRSYVISQADETVLKKLLLFAAKSDSIEQFEEKI